MSIYSFKQSSPAAKAKYHYLLYAKGSLFPEFSDDYLLETELAYKGQYYRSAMHAFDQHAFRSTPLSDRAIDKLLRNEQALLKLLPSLEVFDFSNKCRELLRRSEGKGKGKGKKPESASVSELRQTIIGNVKSQIDKHLSDITDPEEFDGLKNAIKNLIWTKKENAFWDSASGKVYREILKLKFSKRSESGKVLMATANSEQGPLVLIDEAYIRNNFTARVLMELRNELCQQQVDVDAGFQHFKSLLPSDELSQDDVDKHLSLEMPLHPMLWHRYYQEASITGDKALQDRLLSTLDSINEMLFAAEKGTVKKQILLALGLKGDWQSLQSTYGKLSKPEGTAKLVRSKDDASSAGSPSVSAVQVAAGARQDISDSVEICYRRPLDLAEMLSHHNTADGRSDKIALMSLMDGAESSSNSVTIAAPLSQEYALRTNLSAQLQNLLSHRDFTGSNLVYCEANCFRGGYQSGYRLLSPEEVDAARFGFIHAKTEQPVESWGAVLWREDASSKKQKLVATIENVFQLAKDEKVDYLILDALGCDNGYSPQEVAECFFSVHQRYPDCFKKVYFGLSDKQAFSQFYTQYFGSSAFPEVAFDGKVDVLFAHPYSGDIRIAHHRHLKDETMREMAKGLGNFFTEIGSYEPLLGDYAVTHTKDGDGKQQINFSFASDLVAQIVAKVFQDKYSLTQDQCAVSSSASYAPAFLEQVVYEESNHQCKAVKDLMGRKPPLFTVSISISRLEDFVTIMKLYTNNPQASALLMSQYLDLLTFHHTEVRENIGAKSGWVSVDRSHAHIDTLLTEFYAALGSDNKVSISASLQAVATAISDFKAKASTSAYCESSQLAQDSALMKKLDGMQQTLDNALAKQKMSPTKLYGAGWSPIAALKKLPGARCKASPRGLRLRSRFLGTLLASKTLGAENGASHNNGAAGAGGSRGAPLARDLSKEFEKMPNEGATVRFVPNSSQ